MPRPIYDEVDVMFVTCEDVLGGTCGFKQGKDECENCTEVYNNCVEEVEQIMEERGYVVLDTMESEYDEDTHQRKFWVKAIKCKVEPSITIHTSEGVKT